MLLGQKKISAIWQSLKCQLSNDSVLTQNILLPIKRPLFWPVAHQSLTLKMELYWFSFLPPPPISHIPLIPPHKFQDPKHARNGKLHFRDLEPRHIPRGQTGEGRERCKVRLGQEEWVLFREPLPSGARLRPRRTADPCSESIPPGSREARKLDSVHSTLKG